LPFTSGFLIQWVHSCGSFTTGRLLVLKSRIRLVSLYFSDWFRSTIFARRIPTNNASERIRINPRRPTPTFRPVITAFPDSTETARNTAHLPLFFSSSLILAGVRNRPTQ
jgi:hypothetical protein